MRQSTLAAGGFDAHGKTTRKAAFVARMDKLMPWAALLALIEPYYPKAGNGRPPRSMSSMLRMYCIANWFNLADEACEDALYDIEAFREFCGIDLGRQGVPDATTLLHFRRLLETRLQKQAPERARQRGQHHQKPDPSQGGACVLAAQTPVGFCQGSLSCCRQPKTDHLNG